MSLAYRFFIAGIFFALTGTGLGAYMGSAHDFTFAPVHAHINLVGFVTHFLFGLYYRTEPANAEGTLPEAQFICAFLGGIALPVGIIGKLTANNAVSLALIPGTLLTVASMALFLAVLFRGWRRQRAGRTTSAGLASAAA